MHIVVREAQWPDKIKQQESDQSCARVSPLQLPTKYAEFWEKQALKASSFRQKWYVNYRKKISVQF